MEFLWPLCSQTKLRAVFEFNQQAFTPFYIINGTIVSKNTDAPAANETIVYHSGRIYLAPAIVFSYKRKETIVDAAFIYPCDESYGQKEQAYDYNDNEP